MVKFTIGDALKKGIALLKEFNIPGAATDAAVVLGHVLDCTRLHLTVHRDDAMEEEDVSAYLDMISRRCKNEPVSYITGTKEFMSLEFEVTPDVLIPRPDTEILVETVMEALKDNPAPFVIDMCTGSGAIGISLAKYIPHGRVTALDISPAALDIAKKNAKKNSVTVEFVLHDAHKPYRAFADAIVSNPPYICSGELYGLQKDVSDYEPELALDGGEDGLVFYRDITQNAPFALKQGGILAFEVGMGQAEYVREIMLPLFEDITVIKDLAGIDRVVYGRLT